MPRKKSPPSRTASVLSRSTPDLDKHVEVVDESEHVEISTATDDLVVEEIEAESAKIDPSTEPLYVYTYNGGPSTEVDITSVIASSKYSAGYCPDITRNGVGYDYQSGCWRDEEVLVHPPWFITWNRFVAKLNGPKCDKCGAMTAGIGNVGWCRTCDREQGA